MANVTIKDLTPATASDIGADSLVEIQLAAGGSRKITILELAKAVFAQAGIDSVAFADLDSGNDNRVRFVTDGRKPGEGAGSGTGVLAMNNTDAGFDWESVASGDNVVT